MTLNSIIGSGANPGIVGLARRDWGALVVLVVVLMIWAYVRYRRREGEK